MIERVPAMNDHLRASDADRQRAVNELTRHTVAGRLTLDEFDARAEAVARGRTYGDLAVVVADLPTAAVGPAPARWSRHGPVVAAALAVLFVAVVVAALVGWAQLSGIVGPMMSTMGCG